MLQTIKVQISSIDKLFRRVIQGLTFGKSGVKSALEVAPFGTDSNPIKDMIAIYGETKTNGETVIIGYLNKKQLALIGEHRIYSTDEQGAVKSYAWLHNTGIMELNGKVDNAVRHAKLDAALQVEVELINTELVKIATAINSVLPGGYTPVPIQLDITAAKILDILTT